MRYAWIAAILGAITLSLIVSARSSPPGFAQYSPLAIPQGDEFNSSTFAAPFVVRCGAFANPQPCPDPQGTNTWSLNGQHAGYLRIMTQFGSLVGTGAQASNDARNFVVQPADPSIDYSVTTDLAFPNDGTHVAFPGQTAGLLVYQDDDNFISFGWILDSAGRYDLQFTQETNGVAVSNTRPESDVNPEIFLRLTKASNLYTAQYSFDNTTFFNFPPGVRPTSTAAPAGYTADYSAPQVGVFAWGDTNAGVVAAQVTADFNWFRVANSTIPIPTTTPSPTATATSTSTPSPTATPTHTVIPTATGTPIPTAIPATTSPPPTATPRPRSQPSPTATKPLSPSPTVTPRTPVLTFTFDHLQAVNTNDQAEQSVRAGELVRTAETYTLHHAPAHTEVKARQSYRYQVLSSGHTRWIKGLHPLALREKVFNGTRQLFLPYTLPAQLKGYQAVEITVTLTVKNLSRKRQVTVRTRQ